MSGAISKLKSLWARLSDRDYRTAYLDEAVNARLASQIYSLRVSRGLTQSDVAQLTGIAQPTLSRLEADANGVTTTTLKRLASAYDVALSVKFVRFSEFAEEVSAGKVDRPIPSFADDGTPKPLFTLAAITTGAGYVVASSARRLSHSVPVISANSGAMAPRFEGILHA